MSRGPWREERGNPRLLGALASEVALGRSLAFALVMERLILGKGVVKTASKSAHGK